MGFKVLAGSVALAVALGIAGAALAADIVGRPQIVGAPVAGSTLRAVVVFDTQTPQNLRYQWLRLDPAAEDDEDDEDEGGPRIDGATGPEYSLTAADVGYRIAVRVREGGDRKRSRPTAVVTGTSGPGPATPSPSPSPSPVPTPRPSPTPSPQPSPTPAPPSDDTGPSGSPTAPANLVRPFPIVRIKGTVVGGGARVTVLRVRAPARALVRVRCAGRDCPVRRLVRRAGRIRAFERYLRAGTLITIRVTQGNLVGKHVRLRIRLGRPPARRDACALPGRRGAIACPD